MTPTPQADAPRLLDPKHSARLLLLAALGILAVLAPTLIMAATAYAGAFGLAVSPNQTLASGSSRTIGAAWSGDGPYKVNFNCGYSGCANWTSASTTNTSYFTTLGLATCTGVQINSVTKVWDHAGSGAYATGTTTTTFTKGRVC